MVPGLRLRSEAADRRRIPGDHFIDRDQGDLLDNCLGNQDAIEGVLVDGRKHADTDRVFSGDGKFSIAVIEKTAPEEMRIDGEIWPAEGLLDRDLPEAG